MAIVLPKILTLRTLRPKQTAAPQPSLSRNDLAPAEGSFCQIIGVTRKSHWFVLRCLVREWFKAGVSPGHVPTKISGKLFGFDYRAVKQ